MIRLRMFWYSFAVLLAGFTGCSCQSENASSVNPETVYQAYSITYNTATKKTTAIARFRSGGITGPALRLDGMAKITHNHFELKPTSDEMHGFHYVGAADGFIPDHTFTYTDTHGKTYTNSAKIISIEFADNAPVKISRSHLPSFPFVGAEPINDDEAFQVALHPPFQKHLMIHSNLGPGAKELTIHTENYLHEFPDGKQTIQLERSRNVPLQQATPRGGAIAVLYMSAPRVVTIEP